MQLEKRPTSPQAFVQLHNLFSDYLFVLLGLSSGYRPVNEIFGRLEDIDTLTGMYFISDKENRIGAGEGRFIYLPSLVMYVTITTSRRDVLISLDNFKHTK